MAELNDIQLRIIVQGTGLDNLQRTNDQLAKLASGVQNSAKAASTAKSAWTNFADGLSNLERRFDAVFRAASHLQALGRDLTGMGMAGMGFLKSAVDEWGNFEFALNRAAGALEIFDTQTPIYHRLQNAINDVAKEVRVFPAEDVAMAMYVWGSATGQVVESQEDLNVLVGAVTPLLKAAAVTQTGYEVAIKGVYSILQQYNMGLEDAGDVTAKLMLSSQKTALEFGNLIEAFKMTGPVAAAAGATFDDMVTFMGMIGDAGIRGSQSGRALRQTFIKLVKPTARATDALNAMVKEQLGLDKTWQELAFPEGKFIGMKGYFDLLARGTRNMTDEQRGFLLATITTANELPVMTAVVSRQIDALKEGKNAWDDQKYALDGAQESFDAMFNLLKNSWQGVLGGITNTIGPIVRLIGSSVAEMAAPFLNSFAQMLDKIYDFLDTHPEIVKWGVQLAAIASIALLVGGAIFTAVGVLLAFGAGIAFVIKGAGLFLHTFPRFFPILGALIAVVTAIATNFGGLRDALGRVVIAFGKVFKAMDSDEAGASLSIFERLGKIIMPVLESAAMAVAGALNLLADALEWIAGNETAMKVVEGLAQALGLFLAAGFISRILGIGTSIATLGGAALGAGPHIRMLTSAFGKFFSISTLWPPTLLRNFKELNAALSMTASDAKGKFTSMVRTVVSSAGSMAGGVAAAARGITLSLRTVLIATGIGAVIVAIGLLYEAWTNNWGDIQGKTAAVVDWIVGKWNEFTSWIASFVDTVQMHFINIKWAITQVWRDITTNIGNAITNIITFFRDLPTNIGTFLSQLWTNITTWIGKIVTIIVEFPGKAWSAIVSGFNNIMTWLGDWWTSLGDSTSERVGFIVGFIIALPIRALIEIVKGFVTIWNFFVEWWENLMAAIGDWVTSVVDTITTWISKLPGRIANFFGQIWKNLSSWWNTTITSVSTWVSRTVTTILDWIGKLPGRIASFFAQVWSNVSTWFGNFIVSVGTWASQTVEKIISFIMKLPGRVMEWFTSTFNNVSSWFRNSFVPNIGTWTMNAVNNVIKFFKELPGKVIDEVGRLVPKLRSFFHGLPGKIWDWIIGAGKAIVEGVWKGIQNAWQWFTDQITGFFRGIVNGVKAALGISSPSKVFAEIGTEMMRGLSIGVGKNRDAVDALSDQVDTLVKTARQLRTEEMGALGGDFGFTAEGERRLIVDMRVSSPDGTVNNASREAIREIFTAEELVSSLEHMATVG